MYQQFIARIYFLSDKKKNKIKKISNVLFEIEIEKTENLSSNYKISMKFLIIEYCIYLIVNHVISKLYANIFIHANIA